MSYYTNNADKYLKAGRMAYWDRRRFVYLPWWKGMFLKIVYGEKRIETWKA